MAEFPAVYLLASTSNIVAAQLDAARYLRSSYLVEVRDVRTFNPAESLLDEGLNRESFMHRYVGAFALMHGASRSTGSTYAAGWPKSLDGSTWKQIVQAVTTPNIDFNGRTDNELATMLGDWLKLGKVKSRKVKIDGRILGMISDLRMRTRRDAELPSVVRGARELALIGLSRLALFALRRYVGGQAEYDAAIFGASFFRRHWQQTRETPAEFFAKYQTWRSQPVGVMVRAREARLRNKKQKIAVGDT